MAITATFKQECPTCGAAVKIDDKMIGKKVECTKCKDKFVAEKPDDEADDDEAARGKSKGRAAGKKSAKSADDDDDLVEPDDDSPQVKPGKGKSGANGKAKHRDDDDDEPEAKGKGKSKKDGGSNKLTIGLALAVVGVLVLGVAGFFIWKGTSRTTTPVVRPKGDGPTKGDDGPGKVTPAGVTPDTPKVETNLVALNDAELSRLSNLLPNDAEYVFRVYAKDVWGPAGPLHEAFFRTSGALNDGVLKSKLGFSLAALDDLICAERYTSTDKQPSWRYAVLHFSEALNEAQLKSALGLKIAPPLNGQAFFKMTEPHPYFDVLSRFSFGIPNWIYGLEKPRPDRPLLVRLYNAQTLIVGDEWPVVALLNANGQFELQTPRSAVAPPPNPGVDDKNKDKDKDKEAPKEKPPIKFGPGGKGKLMKPGLKTGARLDEPFAPFAPFEPGTQLQTVAAQAPATDQPAQPEPKATNMVTREDMYLTIRPSLKKVLDRVEARKAESTDKVLISSTTDMEKNYIKTTLPEYRDRIVRQPRQFWDITVMLYEPAPRIQTLGTALIQNADAHFQLRNEISCGQEADAAAIKKEIMDTTSFTIAQFLKNLVNHEVRLPQLPKKEPEKEALKVAPPGPNPPGKKAPVPKKQPPPVVVLTSQMSVNQQEQKKDTVDFVLDLVLDNSTLTQINNIAILTASALRAETEAAASKSVRHWLAKAGKTVGEKGVSDRDVPAGRFPPGAFPRTKTPFYVDQEPRNRISWMASLLPYLGQQHLYNRLQFDKSWRDPSNWMAANTIVPQFLDPTYPDYLRRVSIGGLPLDFGATHYVGVAGIGLDAASYNRNDPAAITKRGVFSNDGSASLDEIRKGRGLANTMMMIQIPHDGLTGVSPWIAGGGATLRGVPEKNSIAPFILSRDKNDKPIEHQGKRGTFVLMADGSVRFVDQNVSDDVFKAMATVQGPAPENFNPATNPSTPLLPAPDKVEVETPIAKPSDLAFVVPGKFSIDTPAGYKWSFVQDVTKDGRTEKIYACVNPAAKGQLALEMEEKKLDTDEQKRSMITKDLEKNIAERKAKGLDLKEDIKPNLQSPIPARIEFRYKAALPDGSSVIFHAKIIFGRSIYAITAIAPTVSEAQALLKVADSFKELPPLSVGSAGQTAPSATALVVPGRFSIETPAGFKWGPPQETMEPGRTVTSYRCTTEASKSNFILVDVKIKHDTDEKRRSEINKMLSDQDYLRKKGFTPTVVKQPKLDAPIPDRVDFWLKCKTPSGGSSVIYTIVIFGRSTYTITANAVTEEEALDMLRLAESFKEQ